MSAEDRAAQRIQMMIAKALVKSVDDTGDIQLVKIAAQDGVVQDKVERIQNFGFTSRPPADSEAIALYLQGNRDHGVVIACDSGASRITGIESGDSVMYSAHGDKIHMKKRGIFFNDGTDYAVAYEDLKTAFDQLRTDHDALVASHNSHVHVTTATIGAAPTVGAISPTVSPAQTSTADMTPSRVAGFRLP